MVRVFNVGGVVFAAICTLMLALAPARAGGQAPSFEAAAATVDAFHAALAKGNRDGALALLGDDMQIYEQGWVERSKQEYASHHLASDIEFSAAVTRTQTKRGGTRIGNVAYVMTETKTMGTFEDKAINSIGLETMVVRRSGKAWRIVHIHWSSRDVKK
jgi:ketosteroid isomerase-like protein